MERLKVENSPGKAFYKLSLLELCNMRLLFLRVLHVSVVSVLKAAGSSPFCAFLRPKVSGEWFAYRPTR